MCPKGSQRFRPYFATDATLACTRHHEVPHPRTALRLAQAAKGRRLSPNGLDRTDVRPRSLLVRLTWWRRDPNTAAVSMVNGSDVGDRPEARMGLLQSYREAMNQIFATIMHQDGIDRREAALLRTAIEACLQRCCDLLAWAPCFMRPPLSDPAGAWEDLGRRQDPLVYAMALLDEALPPLRDPALCKLREDDRCFICALHYDLLGMELGLVEQDTHSVTAARWSGKSHRPAYRLVLNGGRLAG